MPFKSNLLHVAAGIPHALIDGVGEQDIPFMNRLL